MCTNCEKLEARLIEIENRLGISEQAPDWYATAYRLKAEGLNNTQIAKAVGKSRQAVSWLFNR